MSSFAIVKLKYLKASSEMTPIIESYQLVHHTAQASYLLMTELNGVRDKELSLLELLKIYPIYKSGSTCSKIKQWCVKDYSNRTTLYYYIDANDYIKFIFYKKDQNYSTYRVKAGELRLRGKFDNSLYHSILKKRTGKSEIKEILNLKTGEDLEGE